MVFSLDLTVTPSPGKLDGSLESIAEDGRRHMLVSFVIVQGQESCSLVWTEGGVRYNFSYERFANTPTCFADELARFSLKSNPSSRAPYPIVIEFRITENAFSLRRAQGPQHGAAVDRLYTFELK